MVVIKDMEMPNCCEKCPLMGVDGSPRGPFSPMMCIAIWATKRERKHCVEGKILDDCPLTEIVTCKDCDHCRFELVEGIPYYWCDKDDCVTSEDFYCKNGERKE